MPWSGLFSLLKWPLTLAVLGCLLGLAYLAHEQAGQQPAEERRPDQGGDAEGVVKLTAEQVRTLDLRDAPARAISWQPRIVVYGRVVPNPRATAEVRAALAGTLRPGPDGAWPALGATLKAGQGLGWLDVRIGPHERLDLEAKLRQARLQEQGAEDVVKIQQERVARLDLAGGGISRAELDAARVQLAEARTHLAVARGAVKQWEEAVHAIDSQGDKKDSIWSQPLTVPIAGEITEIPARPGMALQAGDLVARVVDFHMALVRVDLPANAVAAGPPPALELFAAADAPAGEEGMLAPVPRADQGRPIRAIPIGPAPRVDAASQTVGYWYEAPATSPMTGAIAGPPPTGAWRPGLFVKGYLAVAGAKPRPAVAVPATALLYYQGRTILFVRARPDTFERREVAVLGRQGDDWILAEGVRPGDRVVTQRAQALLSEAVLAARPAGEKDDD
jgi:hypothetical protein